MWLAQTDATRHGPASFAHHAELPELEINAASVRLMAGSLGEATSPVSTDWPLIGAEIQLRGHGLELPADPGFEHAVIPIDRATKVDDAIVEPGSLAFVPAGPDGLRIETPGNDGRVLLIGGVPFPDRIQMWWNFVARTRDELTQAWQDWQRGDDDRFAPVPSSLERIEAPTPLWIRD